MDPYYLIGEEDDLDDEQIELLGELMDEDPILGQRAALHRRIRASRGGMMRPRTRIKKALVPNTPGVPKPGARELPLGFTPVQFVNAGALNLRLTANPQVPLKGRRLVIALAETGTAGQAGLVTIVDLKIGQRSQLVSSEPLIVNAFGPTSFGVDMALDPVVPGNLVTLDIAITGVLGVGDKLDVGAMIFGLSIA
jgi:hypothetical protein